MIQELLGCLDEARYFNLYPFRVRPAYDSGYPAAEFVQALYDSTGVSLLDATAFGASAEGYVRVSCTVSDEELKEACRRIKTFMENL